MINVVVEKITHLSDTNYCRLFIKSKNVENVTMAVFWHEVFVKELQLKYQNVNIDIIRGGNWNIDQYTEEMQCMLDLKDKADNEHCFNTIIVLNEGFMPHDYYRIRSSTLVLSEWNDLQIEICNN